MHSRVHYRRWSNHKFTLESSRREVHKHGRLVVRKSYLLGAKLKAVRKRNGLTLEELSARCLHVDAQTGPSESYLSMIESGKRTPSREVLALLASVFQREASWFLNDNI